MDSLVGRRDELRQVAELVDAGARLVTVTGPAGVGKTRLVREWLPENGVFVDLSDARSAADIESFVARAVMSERGEIVGSARADDLLANLGHRCVVLDEVEHLVDPVVTTLERWLKTSVRFVVTSRQRLRMSGETVFDLGPLPVPEDVTTAEESESVRLLLARARQLRRGFRLRPEQMESVVRVVQALEGIPLALELAAPRLVLLGPDLLLERLSERLSLLGGREDALRTTIATSWELLDETDRAAFAQCSVFRGGFDLDAAEHTLLLPDGTAVLDALQSLFDKSLLRPEGEGGRFAMYSSLRDFAAERLGADGESLRARHAGYFAELAEQLVDMGHGEDPAAGWRRLFEERENIRAAADHAPDPDVAARAAVSLAYATLLHGWDAEDDARVTRAIERATTRKADLLRVRGMMRANSARIADAMRDVDAAIALAQQEGDRKVEGKAWKHRAFVARIQGDISLSVELLEQRALPLLESEGCDLDRGQAMVALAAAATELGDLARAEHSALAAIELLRRIGALRDEGVAMVRYSYVCANSQRMDEAVVALAQAESLAEQVGDQVQTMLIRWLRGAIALARRDHDGAAAHFGDALVIARQIGSARHKAVYLGYLAIANLRSPADLGSSRQVLLEQAAQLRESEVRLSAVFLAWAAGCAARLGDPDEARAALAEARGIIERSEDPLLRVAIEIQGVHVDPSTRDAALALARHPLPSGIVPAHYLVVICSLNTLTWPEAPGSDLARREGVLVVDAAGGCFLPPGGRAVVDLSSRPTLTTILLALVERRRRAPGEYVSQQQLIERGWPAETSATRSATNRLHVAIATLRKLGLRDVIVSQRGAYAIHPAITVEERRPDE